MLRRHPGLFLPVKDRNRELVAGMTLDKQYVYEGHLPFAAIALARTRHGFRSCSCALKCRTAGNKSHCMMCVIRASHCGTEGSLRTSRIPLVPPSHPIKSLGPSICFRHSSHFPSAIHRKAEREPRPACIATAWPGRWLQTLAHVTRSCQRRGCREFAICAGAELCCWTTLRGARSVLQSDETASLRRRKCGLGDRGCVKKVW